MLKQCHLSLKRGPMNKSGDANRSVRNTKAKLRASMLALMQQKPVKEITVKELADLANMNRGTFYFHYTDIYALLETMEDEFFTEFDRVSSSQIKIGGAFEYLMAIFDFLGANAEFCRAFLGPNGDTAFVERVKYLVDAKCSAFWRNAAPQGSQERFNLYNAFIINGCVGVIQKWLEGGMKETPEEIAQLIATIVSSSALVTISR